jgi:hypothetical protein
MFPVYDSVSWPRQVEVEALVISGGTHPNPVVRTEMLTTIRSEIGIRVTHVNGNHDYLGSAFPNGGGDLIPIDSARFTVATLWIYLDRPLS